jgi:hypothetical protein
VSLLSRVRMAVPDVAQDENPDQDFLDRSYLSYVLPAQTSLDLERLRPQTGQPNRLTVDSIEQRDSLYFGWHIRDPETMLASWLTKGQTRLLSSWLPCERLTSRKRCLEAS